MTCATSCGGLPLTANAVVAIGIWFAPDPEISKFSCADARPVAATKVARPSASRRAGTMERKIGISSCRRFDFASVADGTRSRLLVHVVVEVQRRSGTLRARRAAAATRRGSRARPPRRTPARRSACHRDVETSPFGSCSIRIVHYRVARRARRIAHLRPDRRHELRDVRSAAARAAGLLVLPTRSPGRSRTRAVGEVRRRRLDVPRLRRRLRRLGLLRRLRPSRTGCGLRLRLRRFDLHRTCFFGGSALAGPSRRCRPSAAAARARLRASGPGASTFGGGGLDHRGRGGARPSAASRSTAPPGSPPADCSASGRRRTAASRAARA